MNRKQPNAPSRAFTLIELLIVVAIIAILAAIAIPNLLLAQTRAKVARVHADQRAYATAIEAYSIDWNEYPNTFNLGGSGGADALQPSQVDFSIRPLEEGLLPLSTPVAYMTAANLEEPFNAKQGWLLYEGWNVLDQANGPTDAAQRKALYLYAALPPDAILNNPLVVQFILDLINQYGPGVTLEDVQTMIRKRWFLVSPGPDTYYSFDRCMSDDPDPANIFPCVFNQVADAAIDSRAGIYDPTNGTVSRGDIVRTAEGISFAKN